MFTRPSIEAEPLIGQPRPNYATDYIIDWVENIQTSRHANNLWYLHRETPWLARLMCPPGAYSDSTKTRA